MCAGTQTKLSIVPTQIGSVAPSAKLMVRMSRAYRNQSLIALVVFLIDSVLEEIDPRTRYARVIEECSGFDSIPPVIPN